MSTNEETFAEAIKLTYPEHGKLMLCSDKSQSIGEFIEWLPSQDLVICSYEDGRYLPAYINIPELLAKFFDIDLHKLDAEKRQMLDELRRN